MCHKSKGKGGKLEYPFQLNMHVFDCRENPHSLGENIQTLHREVAPVVEPSANHQTTLSPRIHIHYLNCCPELIHAFYLASFAPDTRRNSSQLS